MAIAQQLAGYTLGKADLLRRAMGKKKREVLDAEFVGFAAGMTANGFSTAAIKTLWDILVPFSDYAFNKAHTAAYGLVSYWTAYLKANYPAEYMAALLTSVRDDKDKSALYLNECRRMGIKVLPPDVNESDANFTPRRHRHPVRAVRDPQRRRQRGGRRWPRPARRRAGSPTSPTSSRRSTAVVCNKRTVESLIKAGAFDSLGHPRRACSPCTRRPSTQFDRPSSATRRTASSTCSRGLTTGRRGRDDAGVGLTVVDPGARRSGTRATCSRTSGRCSGSTSPTTRCSASSTCWPRPPTARSPRSPARTTGRTGRTSRSAGLVSGLQRKVTKQGDVWAIATIEDLEGAIEVMFFPQTYNLFATSLAEDADGRGQGPAATGGTTCPS